MCNHRKSLEGVPTPEISFAATDVVCNSLVLHLMPADLCVTEASVTGIVIHYFSSEKWRMGLGTQGGVGLILKEPPARTTVPLSSNTLLK